MTVPLSLLSFPFCPLLFLFGLVAVLAQALADPQWGPEGAPNLFPTLPTLMGRELAPSKTAGPRSGPAGGGALLAQSGLEGREFFILLFGGSGHPEPRRWPAVARPSTRAANPHA